MSKYLHCMQWTEFNQAGFLMFLTIHYEQGHLSYMTL